MRDSLHKASKAVYTSMNALNDAIKSAARGLLNMAKGNHTADQPESCKDTDGAEPSQNLNYAAPAPDPSPGSINSKDEHSNQKRQQNVKIQTGYDLFNDNGIVIIESSDDEQKIRGIKNRAGDNIGSRNGIVEIRTGNQRKIHSIKNRTFNNVGNENGVVKIGKFPSA